MTYYIKHGGTLQIGDFIAVNKKYHIEFGWYSGNGKSGTLQYVKPTLTISAKAYFDERAKKGELITSRDKQGFSLDHIMKEYVKHSHTDMVVKINDASDLFTGRDLELYEQARDILKAMNVIKH